MSIMLSRIVKYQSYEDTLEAFEKMEQHLFPRKKFGTEEFNILLRAFCTQRQMKEARSVFNKLHSRFPPDTKTMTILLLGFKESGDITAVELFYHEMVKRGFKFNSVTYSIKIDVYCKKGRLGDALKLFEEMDRVNCLPAIETISTLIHGAGIARNIPKAKELFYEIFKRNLQPDTGAYNALLSSLIKSRDVKSAAVLMDEMKEKPIEFDHLTYHTMFWGLIRTNNVGGFIDLYERMVDKSFLPKARTIGNCPHSHSLEILVTRLCSHGRVEEAFECSEEMLKRGRHMSELAFQMLKSRLRFSQQPLQLSMSTCKMLLCAKAKMSSAVGYLGSNVFMRRIYRNINVADLLTGLCGSICLISGSKPQGTSVHNFVIQLSLSMFFEMQRNDTLRSLDIYRRAGQQTEALSEFYEICNSIDIRRSQKFVKIEKMHCFRKQRHCSSELMHCFSKLMQCFDERTLCFTRTGEMTTESQMHDVATTGGTNNIASSSCTNAPPTMAPTEKPGNFSGIDFKRWHQNIFFYLTTLYLQRNYILSGLQDDLYNVYSGTKTSKELWGALERKYKMKDMGIKKFLVAQFLDFKMIDSKFVVSQVQELQVIIHDFLAEGLIVNDAFQVAMIVEKLPPLWKDFKNYLKHNRKEMTEENNKATERRSKGNSTINGEHIVEDD
ncbi:Pentatricopeptide repeat-containing protein [Capsicum chinense]|nr:Pentatricopeptide repeat-containing protein [Capsicum chinense]